MKTGGETLSSLNKNLESSQIRIRGDSKASIFLKPALVAFLIRFNITAILIEDSAYI